MMRIIQIMIVSLLGLFFINCDNDFPTSDNGKYFVLKKSEINLSEHHGDHAKFFGKYIKGYNNYIMQGIDRVQSTAMDGGGYFIGLKADPPESPIGYDLNFMDNQLIDAPRTTSYCSGSSYSAFVEALNIMYKENGYSLPDSERIESMRMQEIDGSRRDDHVKFWGKWNADGFGNHFALVQYSEMGKEIKPENARPGDFVNISWKSGNGHSVIFLSWVVDEQGNKYMLYWSSQKGTNGLGDQLVSIERIKNIKVVRLINPSNLSIFNPNKNEIDLKITGDVVDF